MRRLIHDARTNIRRIRSVIWMLEHSEIKFSTSKLDRKLKKLGHKLGDCRELDVAIRDANKYGLENSKMKKLRREKRQKLARYLSAHKVRRIDALVGEMEGEVKDLRNIDLARTLSEIRKTIVDWKGRPIHNKAKMHKFRIAMKRVRYVLEALKIEEPKLKRLLDVLGDLHDLEFLVRQAGRNERIESEMKSLKQQANGMKNPTLNQLIRTLSRSRISHPNV